LQEKSPQWEKGFSAKLHLAGVAAGLLAAERLLVMLQMRLIHIWPDLATYPQSAPAAAGAAQAVEMGTMPLQIALKQFVSFLARVAGWMAGIYTVQVASREEAPAEQPARVVAELRSFAARLSAPMERTLALST
jgi:hypothetical protein